MSLGQTDSGNDLRKEDTSMNQQGDSLVNKRMWSGSEGI